MFGVRVEFLGKSFFAEALFHSAAFSLGSQALLSCKSSLLNHFSGERNLGCTVLVDFGQASSGQNKVALELLEQAGHELLVGVTGCDESVELDLVLE
jgi:hypothetical protein